MACDGRAGYPPAGIVTAAVVGPVLRMWAAYDDGQPIGAALAVVAAEHPKHGQVVWFYAAAGRHQDAAAALAGPLVAALGPIAGTVQNTDLLGVLERAFPDNVAADGTALTWQP